MSKCFLVNRLLYLAFGILLPVSVASGGTLSFTLISPMSRGHEGDILEFDGILDNGGGSDLWINGAGITLQGFSSNDVDLTNFILNVSGPLSSGASIGPVAFFDVAVPFTFPSGDYKGSITVQGGTSPFDDGVLQSVFFSVTVASVPEPGSVLFVPLAALFFWFRRNPLNRCCSLTGSLRR